MNSDSHVMVVAPVLPQTVFTEGRFELQTSHGDYSRVATSI